VPVHEEPRSVWAKIAVLTAFLGALVALGTFLKQWPGTEYQRSETAYQPRPSYPDGREKAPQGYGTVVPRPKGSYSAIASDSRNGYIGRSFNKLTPREALSEAVYHCKMAGGVPGFCEQGARLVD
jgi:hypothetical protein